MIYILDSDIKKIPIYLDDKSLDSMIRDIAQVLEGCHQAIPEYWDFGHTITHLKWIYWARECKANYLYLVELGESCIEEWLHRFKRHTKGFNKQDKHLMIFSWARDNVPDLPIAMADQHNNYDLSIGVCTPFPLVMPKKYCIRRRTISSSTQTIYLYPIIIDSYRNFYQAKLNQRLDKSYINEGNGITEFLEYRDYRYIPKWTNRTKPEWVEL